MNKETAQAHWDEFVKPLIILVMKMCHNAVIPREEQMLDVMEFLYVTAMVHGGKHERDSQGMY